MNNHCHVDPVTKSPTPEERQTLRGALLAVWGMGCPNCAMRVRNSLLSLNGVVEARVDHLAGMAEVVFNPTLASIPALIDAVARAGEDGRHEYCAALVAE